MKGAGSMDVSLTICLENALAQYDRVVFLYQLSRESCIELGIVLGKEKGKILLLSGMEAPAFPCDQRRLSGEECRWLLELYLSYSFSDHFILLTDQKDLPWPSAANFVEEGTLTRREMLEAMLDYTRERK